jgi:hypothetical protein
MLSIPNWSADVSLEHIFTRIGAVPKLQQVSIVAFIKSENRNEEQGRLLISELFERIIL